MAQVFERNCYTKIGVGLSSTANGDSPSLLITSTNNSADNHKHCFVGPGAGTNDDIIFCLNRNGGAYGRFDVEFNGIKRFFVAGEYQTNGGFGSGNNALNSKCQNILIGCGKNSIPASLFCSNSNLGAGEWNYPASALAPVQAANSQIVNMVGRELASCNAAYIGLKYCGDHSSTNYMFLGMYGSDAIIAGMPNGDVGIGTHYGKVTGTLPLDRDFGVLTVHGEEASEGDFNSYPGHTSVIDLPTPKECKPDLIVCRPYTKSSPPPAYTNNLRGQIAIGLGVGIYSINPNIGGGPFYGDIRFYTSCYDTNYCTIDRMTITCAGCIGIGTNYPTSGSILDIRGGNVYIDGGSVTDRNLYFRNQSTGTVGGSVRSDQTLSLFAGIGSTPTQAVTIERETLNVGIGTINPQNLLQVAGTIGLAGGATSMKNTSGDFTISLDGLIGLTGNNWRSAGLLVFYTGIDPDQSNGTTFLTSLFLRGLTTWTHAGTNNIMGTASITTANATSTGIDITFDVSDLNNGAVFAVIIGGTATETISIS